MGYVQTRVKSRNRAIEIVTNMVSNPAHVLVIHYSCESFYDITDGRTPRITSIAVRYVKTGQTKSFSIHKLAERKKIDVQNIEECYDQLEKDMLKEFFDFVRVHKAYAWVHWNMRDINYGFEAIENRFVVLGGKPETIGDENKFDLSRLLVSIYGLSYIGHPRFESLINNNGITKRDFLPGAEEAKAFNQKEYVKLHQSTLRKVDILNTILEKTAEGKLKTNSKLRDIYSLSPQGIFELAKDNWFFSVGFSVIGLIIGTLISKIF